MIVCGLNNTVKHTYDHVAYYHNPHIVTRNFIPGLTVVINVDGECGLLAASRRQVLVCCFACVA